VANQRRRDDSSMGEKLHYRAIWLSDIHLGTRDAKIHYLIDFLEHTESDYLYLVGDIIDLWKLRSGWYWPEAANRAVKLVLDKARRGTRVVYLTGNHDEALRDYTGSFVSGVELLDEVVHRTADGRRFLVLHGDQFDCVVQFNKWLAHLGSWSYDVLLRLNHWVNWGRRRLGLRYWSLSAYLKHRVKNAVSFIGRWEETISRETARRGLDGLICGHIHHASMQTLDGHQYVNTGDWVESCTALAEDFDGALRILHWSEESAILLDERLLDQESEADADCDRDGRLVPAG